MILDKFGVQAGSKLTLKSTQDNIIKNMQLLGAQSWLCLVLFPLVGV